MTVIALDEVVNRVDSDSDTEDVFEEAEEEFRVNAPLARPEELAGLNGRGQKVLDADHTNVLRPEEASLLLASSSASAVVHSSLTRKEVDYFGQVKREAYALNSFIPISEIVMEKQEKVNLLGNSPAFVQRPVYQEKLGEYIFRQIQDLSRLMRKPTLCICENKDADQLCGNRKAYQRLCFRYTDSTLSLILKSEIPSF